MGRRKLTSEKEVACCPTAVLHRNSITPNDICSPHPGIQRDSSLETRDPRGHQALAIDGQCHGSGNADG